ncbi:MAG: 3-isopropylmalate dehydratase small subunit [Theionarchaea archaeon]|nr:3-isopropylmalate dehydratase small subunit [Theionarchaea archaeon]MBU7002000.1 3-isopropylmalate dehydratase small subunit [Theionarchaea archaeon]MBU7019749.1 3-isopropylmalate dehydratase small subunit [Theionarchaea archaeon]MBU7034631.1 3-isopropylmalate dehydratase small subunit [Theionarchaea archaeon]MBU7040612.1 3-isopropylmalate dehydratase small subunit [Theionarchaea archaeon]
MKIDGIALIVGDDVDTDLIIPTFALQKSRDPRTFADYAFYHTIPGFKDVPEKIIVAGHNFGCGSSREEAVFALLFADVKAVLAMSFAPIFKRNAFNNALLSVQIDTSGIKKNDTLTIDVDRKTVYDTATGEDHTFTLTAAEETLIRQGGLLPMLRKRLASR